MFYEVSPDTGDHKMVARREAAEPVGPEDDVYVLQNEVAVS